MARTELVLFSIENHVALITVNDPDRRNAFTDEMSARLRDAVERAEADPAVHAVVVTGAGKAFCAGADLSALGAAGSGRAESGLRRVYDGFIAVGKLPAAHDRRGRRGPEPGIGRRCAHRRARRIVRRPF
jgi:enoyl-CoA hydratase